MKKVIFLIILVMLISSCARSNKSAKYFHDDNLNLENMKKSSILLLPVKFFNVKNDVNNKFKIPLNEFNLNMEGIVVSELGRLGFKNAFIFNQQKQKELSLFLDIADLAYIAGKTNYNDISNIKNFTEVAKRESIDFVLFARSITITFVSDEKTQNAQKVQDGTAKIVMEIALFDIKNQKIVKQVRTEDIVAVLNNPSDVIFASIKNKIFDLLLHNIK